MRIARVLTRLNLGGPARQVLASDPLLVQRGASVRVFTGAPEPGEGDLFEALAERVEVVRVPGLQRGPAPLGDARAKAFLRRSLADFRPDLVHTHAFKAGWLGRRAARSLPQPPPCVHTFHGHVLEGYFPDWLGRRLIKLEARLARDTARVVAVAHATAEDLVRLGVCGFERLTVVPPGIELDELTAIGGPERAAARDGSTPTLRAQIGAQPEDFVVGVVGRLASVKEPLAALRVFATLAPRRADLHMVFVGDGSERRMLERGIERLDAALQRRVHLVGARLDMPAVWAGLDAALLSSRSEGAPVALIEAAAAGLPAVARAVGGVEEIVAHERTGLVGTTDEELAFALDQLLTDRAAAEGMGRRARLRVADRFGAAALAQRLEQLYAAVLADPEPRVESEPLPEPPTEASAPAAESGAEEHP